jgi:ribonuclease HI
MQVYKLYSDGNYFPRAKKSGFGGYLESPSGEVLVEYTEQIKDPKYAYSFELLGIIRGLQMAKSRGIEHIVSHCDDKDTARKLKEIFNDKIYNIPQAMKPELFDQIIEISKDFKSIKFEYIPRAKNKHADSLSRRYSQMMEENFLKQYDADLDYSQQKLASSMKTNKRIFFSHRSIVRNSHKINPYLVANIRNKRIRRVSRTEQDHNYDFVFNEIFNQDDQMVLRSFHYDKNRELKNTFEKKFSINDSHITSFCDFFADNLHSIKENSEVSKLWISSNYRVMNAFFEQKEKMPTDHWESFLKVNKALDGFEKVLFHNLPFDHKFSPEIAPVEKVKKKLDEEITNLDELIIQFSQSSMIKEQSKHKEQSKCFGAIIRHQLRNYKEKLSRELEDIEISEVIEQTVASMKAKGYTNLPIKQKIK